jgi:hypothetical protein
MPDKDPKDQWPTEWDIPPWELPGNYRFDCEPHRGIFLRRLANASFVFAAFALGLSGFSLLVPTDVMHDLATYGLESVFGCLGMLFGVIAFLSASKELAGVRRGLINPEGQYETEFALRRALQGVLLGLISTPLWGALILEGLGVRLP